MISQRSRNKRIELASPEFLEWLKRAHPNTIQWQLQELDGATVATAYNQGATGVYDGAITGATVAQRAGGNIPYGYLFDGINDYVNIYSAALVSAFNGAEGSLIVFCRVSSASVWTDGTARAVVELYADGNNRLEIVKNTPNNRLDIGYKAGGTQKTVVLFLTATNYINLALTWSAGNDRVRAFINGVQSGADLTGLGTWAGNIHSSLSVIGASIITPGSVWDGDIAQVLLADSELSPGVVSEIYRRSGI